MSAGDGGVETTKGGKMEDCLGVNVRPVVRVDCHLKEVGFFSFGA